MISPSSKEIHPLTWEKKILKLRIVEKLLIRFLQKLNISMLKYLSIIPLRLKEIYPLTSEEEDGGKMSTRLILKKIVDAQFFI